MELAKKFTDLLRRTEIPNIYDPNGIDEIINQFVKDFLKENRMCNFSENTCYLLAYHCVLLSKDLHRDINREDPPYTTPKITSRKMEKEEFLRITQVTCELSIDPDFLSALYDDIMNEKIN